MGQAATEIANKTDNVKPLYAMAGNDIDKSTLNMKQFQEVLTKVDKKLDTIETALTGNQIAKDGGLVQQVADNRKEISLLKEELLRERARLDKIYTWFTVGATIPTIITIAKILFDAVTAK